MCYVSNIEIALWMMKRDVIQMFDLNVNLNRRKPRIVIVTKIQ